MDYFIVEEKTGKQIGPLSEAELREYGITPDTYVWCQGMPDWQRAREVPELAPLLYGDTRQQDSSGADSQPQSSAAPPPPVGGAGEVPHTNWLPWAIVVLVGGVVYSLAGIIFGIIAIRHARNANRSYFDGNYRGAAFENRTAKVLVIIGAVLVMIGFVLQLTGVSERVMNHLLEMYPSLTQGI